MTPPDQAPEAPSAPPAVQVRFSFESTWTIAPTGRQTGFPPGGGLRERVIDIAPVRLAGLGRDEVAAVVRRRAADMALLAQAVAAADIQFSEALQAAGEA